MAFTALAVVAPLFAACGSSGPNATGGAHAKGGTATIGVFSEGPNYVFPLLDAAHFYITNSAYLQNLLYRPLYWFGQGNSLAINYQLSVGKAPVYSDGGKVVTISLNNYRWSDGTPVTARDIEFWENLVVANKTSYGAYSPGGYPDNIASTKVIDSSTIQFTLTQAYNDDWFTDNELQLISPIPQHAWDRTSANGPIGDYDKTTTGAVAVYKFLAAQASDLSTYSTNPLWKVVDGPWVMSAYTPSNGSVSFVPNVGYSGPEKPHLAHFNEQVFTTTASEYNALRSGTGPTVGFGSTAVEMPRAELNRLGYKQVTSDLYQISFAMFNYNNPTVGPLFKQPYVRRALQMLVNQRGLIASYYGGHAVPTCGPIPLEPSSPYLDAHEKSCPNGYNPDEAASLLKAHGWNVVRGGISTCSDPGAGPGQCGAGIARGEQLKFNLIYGIGGIAYGKSIAQMKSDAEAAGVDYELKGESGQEESAAVVACTPSQSACSWQIGESGWVYSPYPSGELFLETGAGSNTSSYSDPRADQLIKSSIEPGNSMETLGAYEDYIADQAPVLWQPVADYVYEVSSKLGGASPPVNGAGAILPEEWYYTR